jgi:hypothetical protein
LSRLVYDRCDKVLNRGTRRGFFIVPVSPYLITVTPDLVLDEWVSSGHSSKDQLIGNVESLFDRAQTTIREQLQQIESIALETPEERRIRTDENHRAFEKVVQRYQ